MMMTVILDEECATLDAIAAAMVDALPADCARDLTPRWADPERTVVRADCGRHDHRAALTETRPGHFVWALDPHAR